MIWALPGVHPGEGGPGLPPQGPPCGAGELIVGDERSHSLAGVKLKRVQSVERLLRFSLTSFLSEIVLVRVANA